MADAIRRAGLARPLVAGIDAVDRLLTRIGRPPLTAKCGSVQVRGYLRHRGFLEYMASGMHEESYYRSLVLKAVDSSTTFVDVGAHIGAYTLMTCERASRVVAFEPDPYNFSALKFNALKSDCRNIELRTEAVAERSGRRIFRAFRSTFGSSLLPRQIDAYRELEVKTISLDEALQSFDLTNLVVKVDVEGAEPLALAGMVHTISRARRLTLFFELNPEALHVGGFSVHTFIKELLSTPMECVWIDERQGVLAPLRGHDDLGKGNVMCVKSFSG